VRKPDRIDKAALRIAGVPPLNSPLWQDMTAEELSIKLLRATDITRLVRREVKRALAEQAKPKTKIIGWQRPQEGKWTPSTDIIPRIELFPKPAKKGKR